MPSLRYVAWAEFDEICRGLAERLGGGEFELVVGVARGGLPAAVFLAHLLGSPPFGAVHASKTYSNDPFAIDQAGEVTVQSAMLPEVSPRRVLLVEDVIAYGDVFTKVGAVVRRRYGDDVELVHATLYADLDQIAEGPHASLLESLFYGEGIDNRATWMVLPWDEKAVLAPA